MIVITENIIKIEEYINESNDSSSGSLLIFCGTTRDNNLGKSVDYLEYESYVDMAKLKYEYLNQYYKSNKRPLSQKFIGNIGFFSKMGSLTAVLTNFVTDLSIVKSM